MPNPLLKDWETPYECPPFHEISDNDFSPALDFALRAEMGEILEIANQSANPTFANTIDALFRSGQELEKVLSVFYSVSNADSNEMREDLMREFAPKLAAHNSDIISNEKLFERIESLWKNRKNLRLSDEQLRVLMLSYRNFVRSGAALKICQKNRIKEIKSRLATLGTAFSQNVLSDEKGWYLQLGEKDALGLPDFMISAAKTAAIENGIDGMIITLSRSLLVPFLQYSPRRDLREKAYKAWEARGASLDSNNKELAKETLDLRREMAVILGYENFAHYKLEIEMAKTTQNVRELLNAVWIPAKERANKDANSLTKMMHDDGIEGDLEKWDWRYYAQKRCKLVHNLDEEMVKPFLQLDQIIKAAFEVANRLFRLDFKEVFIPLYHRDCRAWNVVREGEHIALFIGDYFARSSKRSGAWCSAIRSQAKLPYAKTPIVVNVCNFAKSDPTLLSFDDALTLFHEFGHALHQILSNVSYEMVSGTSVPRDFVELPSQLFEHWLQVPEVLKKFAIHVDTGEAIPASLLDKLLEAGTFDMGFQTVEYIASAMVDIEFHSKETDEELVTWQKRILDSLGMPNAIGMRHATPHFLHIFSGQHYASGYYSYLWAEVMDADAFAAFEEKGNAFDAELAKSLEQNILSKGGSSDPEELFLAFRGRLPKVEALLKARKLLA